MFGSQLAGKVTFIAKQKQPKNTHTHTGPANESVQFSPGENFLHLSQPYGSLRHMAPLFALFGGKLTERKRNATKNGNKTFCQSCLLHRPPRTSVVAFATIHRRACPDWPRVKVDPGSPKTIGCKTVPRAQLLLTKRP